MAFLDKTVEKKLEQCNTLKEVLQILDTYYDLTQPLGSIAKVTVIKGLDKAVLMTGAKLKQQ